MRNPRSGKLIILPDKPSSDTGFTIQGIISAIREAASTGRFLQLEELVDSVVTVEEDMHPDNPEGSMRRSVYRIFAMAGYVADFPGTQFPSEMNNDFVCVAARSYARPLPNDSARKAIARLYDQKGIQLFWDVFYYEELQ